MWWTRVSAPLLDELGSAEMPLLPSILDPAELDLDADDTTAFNNQWQDEDAQSLCSLP